MPSAFWVKWELSSWPFKHLTMTKRRYFGTDGIRGRVGEFPITPDFVMKLGWAAGKVLGAGRNSSVLIGKDTRVSGYMFESALEAGLSAAGVNTFLVGPMPTPAIAYLTQIANANAGIVVSASHNLHSDNGIKFFANNGKKLDDKVELKIEKQLESPIEIVSSQFLGKAERIDDAPDRYVEFCKRTLSPKADLRGLKVVLDCANGAAYHVAPKIMRELGIDVKAIGVSPDGFNINAGCGSTAPSTLQNEVLANHAHLGVAFDGDGDRVIMVDHKGEVVDGDEILYIIAENRKRTENLGVVVGTLMSNFGLEEGLAKLNVELVRANVGDRYVIETMDRTGATLGGEASGHIICLDHQTTGDGITAALQVFSALKFSGKRLHELKKGMAKYPQYTVNVKTAGRVSNEDLESFGDAITEVETVLGPTGRVLLRPSGTEPLVRVMVEGRDVKHVRFLAESLANKVESIINARQN